MAVGCGFGLPAGLPCEKPAHAVKAVSQVAITQSMQSQPLGPSIAPAARLLQSAVQRPDPQELAAL
jgi:hypothetical protein